MRPMPTLSTVNVIPINAIFRMHDQVATLEIPQRIETPHGLNQIVITLTSEPLSGPRATFAAGPPGAAIWLDPCGVVIPTPPPFQVIRHDEKLIIWDTNSSTYEIPHCFWLVVEYDGNTYYLDPTIINQKPVQPTPRTHR